MVVKEVLNSFLSLNDLTPLNVLISLLLEAIVTSAGSSILVPACVSVNCESKPVEASLALKLNTSLVPEKVRKDIFVLNKLIALLFIVSTTPALAGDPTFVSSSKIM